MQYKFLNQKYQLFNQLSQQLKPDHELLKLAKLLSWYQFESDFKSYLLDGQNCSHLVVRLATGLIILQHKFTISDEELAQKWIENPYWQVFCGYSLLQWEFPIALSSLTKWKQKIGPEGIEKVIKTYTQLIV